MAPLMPRVEMREVVRLAKDSALKLLAKMPVLVKTTASVRIIDRSLIVSEVSPW